MTKARDLGRACALALACAALASSPRARASPDPPGQSGPSKSDAPAIDFDAVFRRGLALYAQEKYVEAIAVWEKLVVSMGEQRGFKVLYNLGLAYQKAGDATRAIERLEAFVRRVAEQPGATSPELDERRVDAVTRVRALKESHGALHVLAPPGDTPALVRIDSSDARPAGFTVYVAPGEHEIETWSGTSHARRSTVKVNAGEMRDVTLEAPPALQPTPFTALTTESPPRGPSRPRADRSFPVGWAIAGGLATLASGAAPLVLGLRASSKKSDADDLGAGSTKYAAAVSDFEKARTLYYVSYAIPAAVGAASIALVLITWSARKGAAEEAWVGPCLGAGACASGTF